MGYAQYSSVMAANSEEFHCSACAPAVDEARRHLAWGEGVSLMLLEEARAKSRTLLTQASMRLAV
jgi:hypothetical protein